jgi:hypothetical protein
MTEANAARALYRRWIQEVWSGVSIPDDVVAEDFVGHWPDRDVRGPAGLTDVIAQTRGVFEDLTFEIEVGPLVDGDYVAARWVGAGRLADGEARFFGNDIVRIANGRIVEYWTGTSQA